MKLPRGSTRDDGYRLNGYTSFGKEHWIHPDTFAAINNDGSKDLTPSGNRLNGNVLYGWIIKHGFPKDRYQVLCANCNQRKEWHRRGAYFERTESCN